MIGVAKELNGATPRVKLLRDEIRTALSDIAEVQAIEKLSTSNYQDQEDEFLDLQALPEDKAEPERVSRYFLDDTDIEGKSFVDRGEKIIFTLVALLAKNPKYRQFNLRDFPKTWLHFALGENQGQGRNGILQTLRGHVQMGQQQEKGLPGESMR